MILYLRTDSKAVRLVESKHDVFSFGAVEKWLVKSLVNYRLRFDERTYFAVKNLGISQLVYKRDIIDESARDDPFIH